MDFNRCFRLCLAADNERGATMLEYALLASCIAVVAMTGVTMLGREAAVTLNEVAKQTAGGVQLDNASGNQGGNPFG